MKAWWRPLPSVLTLSIIAWAALSGGSARAAGFELVGGWEGESERGYGFLMPVVVVDLAPRHALVVSGSVSHLRYPLHQPGGVTRVESPGADVFVAYRWRSPRLNATVGPGYTVRETTRRFPAGGESRETESGVAFQGNAFLSVTPSVTLYALASYSAANEYLWSRLGGRVQLTNRDFSGPRTLYLGAEATAQGNDEVESRGLGGVLEIGFPRITGSLQLRAGSSSIDFADGSASSEPYFGFGLYKGF